MDKKLKTIVRRKICASINSLEDAPPSVLNYFFVDDNCRQNGDMVADQSGDLWTYIENEEGIFLLGAYANSTGKSTMLQLA